MKLFRRNSQFPLSVQTRECHTAAPLHARTHRHVGWTGPVPRWPHGEVDTVTVDDLPWTSDFVTFVTGSRELTLCRSN